jgi:hypothetical protein
MHISGVCSFICFIYEEFLVINAMHIFFVEILIFYFIYVMFFIFFQFIHAIIDVWIICTQHFEYFIEIFSIENIAFATFLLDMPCKQSYINAFIYKSYKYFELLISFTYFVKSSKKVMHIYIFVHMCEIIIIKTKCVRQF